jgi:hypothetical protein
MKLFVCVHMDNDCLEGVTVHRTRDEAVARADEIYRTLGFLAAKGVPPHFHRGYVFEAEAPRKSLMEIVAESPGDTVAQVRQDMQEINKVTGRMYLALEERVGRIEAKLDAWIEIARAK